jgi:hypothetical protein
MALDTYGIIPSVVRVSSCVTVEYTLGYYQNRLVATLSRFEAETPFGSLVKGWYLLGKFFIFSFPQYTILSLSFSLCQAFGGCNTMNRSRRTTAQMKPEDATTL